jgi:transposase-like protein
MKFEPHGPMGEHRQHKGLDNRAENSHQPTWVRQKVTRRFKSARHLRRFASVHDQVANLFMHCRYHTNADRGSIRWHRRGLTNPGAPSRPPTKCV